MFDKSNIFDLMLSVHIASCPLFNTQNPVNACHKDPLKSGALLIINKDLLYYNRVLLSTRHYFDNQRKSRQLFTPKPIIDLPGKYKKSVKSRRHFFDIFFNEKEKQYRLLKNFMQIKRVLFKIKFKLNFSIIYLLLLCGALNHGKCINTGEPAAVLVFPIKIKVVEESRPEYAAAGSLGGWVSKVGWNDAAGCQSAWVNGGLGEWVDGGMVIGHWSLGGRFGNMMRYGSMDAWMHEGKDEKTGDRRQKKDESYWSVFNCKL